jgi:hypothetical protein
MLFASPPNDPRVAISRHPSFLLAQYSSVYWDVHLSVVSD